VWLCFAEQNAAAVIQQVLYRPAHDQRFARTTYAGRYRFSLTAARPVAYNQRSGVFAVLADIVSLGATAR